MRSSATAGPQWLSVARPVGWVWKGDIAAKFREVIAAGRTRRAKLPGNCDQKAASSARSSRAVTRPESAKSARAWDRLAARVGGSSP